MHHGVLGVYVCQRQFHYREQLRRRRVFLGPGFVRHDMHGIHREAIVHAVWQFGVDIFLLARQGGEGHLQPHHVFARLQHVAHPVRRPGVVDHRLAFFKAGDGIGHHRRVIAVAHVDGLRQIEGFVLVVNHRFTAPARRAAHHVGFAVTVGIKEFGDLRIFQLFNIGDVILIGGFLVDQISLRSAGHKGAFAVEFLVTACGGIHIVVQRLPVHGGKGGIAGGNRGIAHVVIHFTGGIHRIAQFLQRTADNLGLEGLFRNGALHRLHGNAFARQVSGNCAGGDKGRKRCGKKYVMSHRCSLFCEWAGE